MLMNNLKNSRSMWTGLAVCAPSAKAVNAWPKGVSLFFNREMLFNRVWLGVLDNMCAKK